MARLLLVSVYTHAQNGLPVYLHTLFLIESETGNSFSLSYSLILIAGLKLDLTHPLDNSHIHTPSSHFLFQSLIHSEISNFTHSRAPTAIWVSPCVLPLHFGWRFWVDLITIGQGQVKQGPNCFMQTTFSGGHCLLLTHYSSQVWVR